MYFNQYVPSYDKRGWFEPITQTGQYAGTKRGVCASRAGDALEQSGDQSGGGAYQYPIPTLSGDCGVAWRGAGGVIRRV